MRIRWRGLELPSRVIPDKSSSTDSYGRFVVEPFEQGFGTTIGNSLRRVLLSSLEGAAVTTAKITGVSHEFACMEGVLEDVTDILLNIKGIRLKLDRDTEKVMKVQRTTAGEVRAGDIETDPAVTIINPDHLIATLTTDVNFELEMTVGKGRGYAMASENRAGEPEWGVIAVDSVFSPVIRVRFRTEYMRVGQRTNYDRLILEIWTNGSILPEDALVEASLILRKHLNPLVMYHDLGDRTVEHVQRRTELGDSHASGMDELLDSSVSLLNLSVRASNCLETARISTLRELVSRTEPELLRFRSFGKTSLHEVHRKLADLGLALGMGRGSSPELGETNPTDTGSVPSPAPEEGNSADDGDASSPARTGEVPESSSPPGGGPMEAFTMGE
jgi:DNA-directed RNA polymerase subunit alpha